MNNIERILKKIKEYEKELAREIEIATINAAMTEIVDIDYERIDDSYSLYPLNEGNVFTFGLPRGVGKTKFIIEQAIANENTSIIWFSNRQTIQRVLKEENLPLNRCILLSGTSFDLPVGLSLPKPITRIFVDEYQRLSGENLQLLYTAAQALNRDGTKIKIIRVGTPPL